MATATIGRKKTQGEVYKLVLDGLTQGEILSIMYALYNRAEVSTVAEDVLGYIRSATIVGNEPRLVDLIKKV